MKRSMFAILSILMVLSLLVAACGATQAPVEEPAAQPTKAEEPAAQPTKAEEPAASGEPVEIEFWYIPFTLEEEAHRAVIDAFEAANPDIKVKEVLVQYEEITQKVAAQVPVGQGPDVIKPYYGWVPLWLQNGFLAPLPEDRFPPDMMANTYVAIDAMNIDGKYYGIPSTISVWGLFYNKDYFAEAGIDSPPTTWEEFRDDAIKCTKRDDNGNLVHAGYFIDPGQQEHIVWKILLENFGQKQFGDDKIDVQWNASETGYQAFDWFVNLVLKDKVSEPGFAEAASTGFYQGLSCMNWGAPSWISRIETNAPDLNYGIAPYVCGPADDPALACRNLGQYWNYSMTTKAAADPAKAEASARFLEFLGSAEGIKAYTDVKAGLPPRKDMLSDPAYAEDPNLKPFLETIQYAKAIPWVDELGERDISLQMLDKIFLAGDDPREVLDWGTEQENKLRQDFFANNP
jgi:multiple sugar transport system substrate-binding protein